MANENVPVSESLDVTQTPAEVQAEAVVPEPAAAPLGTEEPVNVITDGVVTPYIPPLVRDDARERALAGIGDGQPSSGSGN